MSARTRKAGRAAKASKGRPAASARAQARILRKGAAPARMIKAGLSETRSKEGPDPRGARNKLGTAFVEAMKQHFARHGEAAIHNVFEGNPYQYLRIVAALMPKLLHLEDTILDEMNDDEIRELLAAIRLARARANGAVAAGPLGPEDDPEAARH